MGGGIEVALGLHPWAIKHGLRKSNVRAETGGYITSWCSWLNQREDEGRAQATTHYVKPEHAGAVG